MPLMRPPAICNQAAAFLCYQTKFPGPLWFCCRPESRQGQLPTSHLGSLRPSPALPQEHAHAPDMQSGQAAAVHTNWQSDDHPQQAAEGDSMQSQHAASLQSGTQSEQMAGSSSSNLPDGTVQQEGTQQQGVHAAADTTSSSMTVVEAAALAASSAGAIVRVPTSTTLSQADQIALRYQHQVSSPIALPSLQGSFIFVSLCMPLLHDTTPLTVLLLSMGIVVNSVAVCICHGDKP